MSTTGNRAKDTTQTVGTGTYSLDAHTATHVQSLVASQIEAVGGSGPWIVEYVAIDDSGTDYEQGIGTLTDGSPDTLSRDAILSSSNGGAAVNWASGTKTIFLAKSAQSLNFRGARIWSDSNQSIPNATDTVLDSWDFEAIDRGGFHDVANSERFTIPDGVSIVELAAKVVFEANATGIRRAFFMVNGVGAQVPVEISASTGGAQTVLIDRLGPWEVSAGHFFDVRVHQTSGAPLNVTAFTEFTIKALE